MTTRTIGMWVWMMGMPNVASAMTCDEAMERLNRGDPVADVIGAMLRDGAINRQTAQCLVDRGAPAAVISAAQRLVAAPEASAEPSETLADPTPTSGGQGVDEVATLIPMAPPPVASPDAPAPPPSRRVPTRARPVGATLSTTPGSDPAAAPPSPSRHAAPTLVLREPAYETGWQGPPMDPGLTETYTDYGVNPFTSTAEDPWSTFAIDVDTGSYTMTRKKLEQGYLPPAAAVRAEEFVNYLPYDYGRPPEGTPFGVDVEMARTPWRDTWTVAIGVQGKRVTSDTRKPVHLTFLIDTSGSMGSPDKLPLVQQSLRKLTNELEDGDTVALVVYAGSAGLVLPSTPISKRQDILNAIGRLQSGGSTAMGAGIQLAYEEAQRAYAEGAVNRVILASDGDANVGATHHGTLSSYIREYAERGITLTTLGFGDGNYRDDTMEQIANDGDGNYFYIDSEEEAQRVLVDKMTSTLEVIAKDVKIQVEWSPDTVSGYRLIGYENRDVADKDFRDDAVDGGEIGAGHQVTALYEITWTGEPGPLGEISVRNKAPGPDARAVERTYSLGPEPSAAEDASGASRQFRMALAAASFAEVLRASNYAEDIGLADVRRLAQGAMRAEYAEDTELLGLIDRAMQLRGERTVTRVP